jgi:anaerobic selenocysteine-containing dehydrogenase
VFDHTPEELIRNVLKPTGITYEELKEKKAIDPVDPNFIPFKDGEFVTPSKKAEFWIGSWKEEGYSPIATHTRPVESPLNDSELAQKYPLASVQKKTRRSVHSTFNNLAWMDELEGKSAFVEIHPADAEVRGISDGDKVVVFNDRGEHPCVAQILDQVKEGVVILENGWWEQQGGSSSYVTNNLEKTLGSIHCCNSTLVEIRKEA